MEENVNELLGIKEETQVNPQIPKAESEHNSAEKILTIVSYIVLACGCLATFICLCNIVWVEEIVLDSYYSHHTEVHFNPTGFATTVMVLLSTLISWSFMKVIANISLTLKDIKKKMK